MNFIFKLFNIIKKTWKYCIVSILPILSIVGVLKFSWVPIDVYNQVPQNTTYLPLENDVTYSFDFLCGATNLTAINFWIGNCPNNSGTLTATLEARDGTILSEVSVFSINALHDSEPAYLPLLLNSMPQVGKFYTMKFTASETDPANPLEIFCIPNAPTISFLSSNQGGIAQAIALHYVGDSGYVPKFALFNLGLSIGLILLLVTWEKRYILKHNRTRECILVGLAIWLLLLQEIATGNFGKLTAIGWIANVLLFYGLVQILHMFLGNIRKIYYIAGTLCLISANLQHYVQLFRGSPLVPWDIYGISTAVAVINRYQFSFNNLQLLSALIFCFGFIIIGHIVEERIEFNIRTRFIEIGRIVACIVVFCVAVYPNLIADLWKVNECYSAQGFYPSFISFSQYLTLQRPNAYSKENCELTLAKQPVIESDVTSYAQNIIIIMNESFADLRFLNNGIIGNEYMPFFDSLRENTIKGKLFVPVFGGGTSNTEFEVLTGISVRNIPSTPYVTMMSQDIDSIAWRLRAQGMSTFAFHPFRLSNWNRSVAYPHLGIEKLIGESDMETEKERLRWCISDSSNYQEIIHSFEKNNGKPFFMFNVTLQNHSSYAEVSYDNFPTTVDLSKYGDYPAAEAYLSLIKESDKALERLISYFEQVDEPTLICFFGDHQPNLEDGFYNFLLGTERDTQNEEANIAKYVTPFLIWTNYDIQEEVIEKISSNYLSSLILLTAGRDLSGYEAFTYQLYKNFPVVSPLGIYDSHNNFFTNEKDINSDLLEQSNQLMYYQIKG